MNDIPDDVGHRLQRPGDGLRQPRRHERDRASPSRATRRRARSASTASGSRTRRGRTSSRASARRCRSCANDAARRSDSLEHRMPEAFKELVAICREAREALPRHAGPRVHDPERQALHAPVSQREAHGARGRAGGGRDGEGGAHHEGGGGPARRPGALDQLLHPTLDPNAPKRLLARGLGASPGAASGHIVFSADEAERRAGQGKPVILVRIETSPEDIHGMKAARGILTARGGMTSHAAVVARGMGKPCVAGSSAIAVNYEAQTMTITVYDDDGHAEGDGDAQEGGHHHARRRRPGQVFEGAVPTVSAALSRRVRRADGRGPTRSRTMKVRANADTPLDARTARAFGAEGIGLCRTEHMFFEEDRIPIMREMILSDDAAAAQRGAREAPARSSARTSSASSARWSASRSRSASSTRRSTSSSRPTSSSSSTSRW